MSHSRRKMHFQTCASNEDSYHPVHLQSDQSLPCPQEENASLDNQTASREDSDQTVWKRRTGWSESLLGTHIQRQVFLCCVSNLDCIEKWSKWTKMVVLIHDIHTFLSIIFYIMYTFSFGYTIFGIYLWTVLYLKQCYNKMFLCIR